MPSADIEITIHVIITRGPAMHPFNPYCTCSACREEMRPMPRVRDTLLTEAERQRAHAALSALPGMTMDINAGVQARSALGLIRALETAGRQLQALHDQVAALEDAALVTRRDLEGVRRILGGGL